MSTTAPNQENDPFVLRRLYQPLRVVDVCDAMDGIGYFDVGLMEPEIRPLWAGMKFWGVAFTIRCVPANRPGTHRRWVDGSSARRRRSSTRTASGSRRWATSARAG